jgi:hypothetical protein
MVTREGSFVTVDDSWALPGSRDDAASQAAQPASQPTQTPAAYYGTFDGAGAGIAVLRTRPSTPDPLLRPASGLLIAAALTRVWYLLTHVGNNPPLFEFVSVLAREGFILVLTLVVAVLVLLPKTREAAQGAIVALALLVLAGDFDSLRPSVLNARQARAAHWSWAAGFVLFVAAGVLVVVRILLDPRRPRDRQSRAERIAAVFGGLLGAVLWIVASLLDTVRLTEHFGPAALAKTTVYGGWSHVDAWHRAAYIVVAAALLALVMLAATGRSSRRSLGLMLGAALLPTADILGVAIQQLAPVASFFGASRVDQVTREGVQLTVTPLAGYWVGIVAVAVLAAVTALRYALAPWRAPYPEQRLRPPKR